MRNKRGQGKPGDGFDWDRQRKFDQATAWQDHLSHAPRFGGVPDLYSDDPYAIAMKCCGYSALKMFVHMAKAGHRKAVADVVRLACELTEAVEEIAGGSVALLTPQAMRRADWPVMVCRHEVSDKQIATYLDGLHLGQQCAINASGIRRANYSLRTPINRFVWWTLRRMPGSLELMSDVPALAAIKLDSLPPLTKATAQIWADKAIMPYICVMHDDFSKVPEFASILRRPDVRTRGQQRREIRKDIIRSLRSLAPSA